MNNMQQTVRRFRIITLRPHWGQYIIAVYVLVSLVLFLVALRPYLQDAFLILGSVTTLMMLWLSALGNQFIVPQNGILAWHLPCTSDYIELYPNRGLLSNVASWSSCSIEDYQHLR